MYAYLLCIQSWTQSITLTFRLASQCSFFRSTAKRNPYRKISIHSLNRKSFNELVCVDHFCRRPSNFPCNGRPNEVFFWTRLWWTRNDLCSSCLWICLDESLLETNCSSSWWWITKWSVHRNPITKRHQRSPLTTTMSCEECPQI